MNLFCNLGIVPWRTYTPLVQDALLDVPEGSVPPWNWTISNQTQQMVTSILSTAIWLDKGNQSGLPVWITILELSRACTKLVQCCCKETVRIAISGRQSEHLLSISVYKLGWPWFVCTGYCCPKPCILALGLSVTATNRARWRITI